MTKSFSVETLLKKIVKKTVVTILDSVATTIKAESKEAVPRQCNFCHAPIPGPTRLVDPNRVRGARPYTGTLYLIFFSKPNLYLWVWPTSYNRIKISNIYIKRTTTGVVSIKIYTHLLSLIYKYKTVLLHLQIKARNLHVVNPY